MLSINERYSKGGYNRNGDIDDERENENGEDSVNKGETGRGEFKMCESMMFRLAVRTNEIMGDIIEEGDGVCDDKHANDSGRGSDDEMTMKASIGASARVMMGVTKELMTKVTMTETNKRTREETEKVMMEVSTNGTIR